MTYYAIIADSWIISVNTNNSTDAGNITESEYNAILNLIRNKPSAPEGYDYWLKADTLEWELVELPEPEPTPEDEELSAEEALEIITGGGEA